MDNVTIAVGGRVLYSVQNNLYNHSKYIIADTSDMSLDF
jgi:hypothetical protein